MLTKNLKRFYEILPVLVALIHACIWLYICHLKVICTLVIFAHNIVIKRYCDIWQFLATDSYWPTKISSYQNLVFLVLGFDKSLPLLGHWIQCLENINVVLSFNRNIVCKNVYCVKGLTVTLLRRDSFTDNVTQWVKNKTKYMH